MKAREQCAVVIPCLDEERTIAQVTTQARSFLPRVIVVDDGSADQTARLAGEHGACVIGHSRPRGKGMALQTGFEQALKMGCSWALALDGDGQHSPADIPRFLSALESSAAQMIVGDRMGHADAMPFIRRQVNRWMSRVLSNFCGQQWPDTQCGMRLVDLRAWRQFAFRARHFEIESELFVRFARAGLRIAFVPIQARYAKERSKIRPLRDTLRWFRWWRAIRAEFGVEWSERPRGETAFGSENRGQPWRHSFGPALFQRKF